MVVLEVGSDWEGVPGGGGQHGGREAEDKGTGSGL